MNQAAADAGNRGFEVMMCTLHERDPLGKFVRTFIGILTQYFEEPSKNIDTALSVLLDMVEQPIVSRWKNRQLLNVTMATLVVHAVRELKKPLLFVIHHQHLATPLTMDVFARMAHVSRSEGHSVQFLFAVDQDALTTNPLTKQRFPGALHLVLKPLSVRNVALSVGALLYRRPPPTRLARMIHLVRWRAHLGEQVANARGFWTSARWVPRGTPYGAGRRGTFRSEMSKPTS